MFIEGVWVSGNTRVRSSRPHGAFYEGKGEGKNQFFFFFFFAHLHGLDYVPRSPLAFSMGMDGMDTNGSRPEFYAT